MKVHEMKFKYVRQYAVWGPLWPQLMWKVLLMVSNMMMLKKLCFRKVSILNPSALFCANPVPGAPMSPAFLYARGARQGSVEGPDMWNQVLDNALREPAGRWETEGVGFMLARDYRKAKKKRRGSSGDAVKDEGRVLRRSCWADDFVRDGRYNEPLDTHSGRHDQCD